MTIRIAAVIITVFLSLACRSELSAEVFFSIDQRNEASPTQNYNIRFFDPRQSFVPVFESLNRIDVRLADANGAAGSAADLQVRVYSGASSTPLATSNTISLQDSGAGYQDFDYVPFRLDNPLDINPGFQYRFEVADLAGNAVGGFMWTAGPGDDYASGFPVLNGTADVGGRDFLFRLGLEQENRLDLISDASGSVTRNFTFGDFSISEFGFISDVSGTQAPPGAIQRQARAVNEFNLSDLVGRNDLLIVEATLAGEIGINNGLDTGTRQFQLGHYAGDGLLTIDDYSVATEALGTASLTVAQRSTSFSFDVTQEVTDLLGRGGQFFGLRTDPLNYQAPSAISNPILTIRVAAVPEPTLAGVYLVAMATCAVRRQRRAAK